MDWGIFPSDTVISKTCRYHGYTYYLNVPKPELLSSRYLRLSISVQGKPIRLKCKLLPKYETLQQDGKVTRKLIMSPDVYCKGISDAIIMEQNNELWLEGVVTENATVEFITTYPFGKLCEIKLDTDDNYVDTYDNPNQSKVTLTVSNRVGTTLSTNVVLGVEYPKCVGTVFTWSLISEIPISLPNYMNDLIKVNCSKHSKINFIGYLHNVTVSYYSYENNQWQLKHDSQQHMAIYAVFSNNIGELIPIIQSISDPYAMLIVVDPNSKQNITILAILFVLKQFNEFKIIPGNQSNGKGIYSSNGYAWVEKSVRVEGGRAIEYIDGVYVKTQFRLDLSGFYGIPVIIDTPVFFFKVMFPKCIMVIDDWTKR